MIHCGAFFKGQYVWGKNTSACSASGERDRRTILIRSLPKIYTDRGTVGDFSADYERDFTPN